MFPSDHNALLSINIFWTFPSNILCLTLHKSCAVHEFQNLRQEATDIVVSDQKSFIQETFSLLSLGSSLAQHEQMTQFFSRICRAFVPFPFIFISSLLFLLLHRTWSSGESERQCLFSSCGAFHCDSCLKSAMLQGQWCFSLCAPCRHPLSRDASRSMDLVTYSTVFHGRLPFSWYYWVGAECHSGLSLRGHMWEA